MDHFDQFIQDSIKQELQQENIKSAPPIVGPQQKKNFMVTLEMTGDFDCLHGLCEYMKKNGVKYTVKSQKEI